MGGEERRAVTGVEEGTKEEEGIKREGREEG